MAWKWWNSGDRQPAARRTGQQRGQRRAYTLLQPLGVCAGITPFNFPAMIPLWMSDGHRHRQRAQ
ncbi:aldehyde dehydrogenase family protein [Pantoea ananatis]|uniref:aldehyde dehydrogenase family protein n=1 Tax=Pantoea ananas TaxID=553 RepID=UPI00221E61F4|nr:aldehyde dehydrogenase family protein [Pantoea ananatis]